jgi:hypothetical protein
MAKIPKLNENPYQNLDTESPDRDSSPNYARRRRVAGAIAGVALAPLLVKAWVESSHYGYHGKPASSETQPK